MKTIIEPFRIKAVEPIRQTTVEERQGFLEEAGYNLFLIDARNILKNLPLTRALSDGPIAAWTYRSELPL